ncbi:hypothetical protein RCL1_004664 [Eukaryota sp. TZLM3-RCL]
MPSSVYETVLGQKHKSYPLRVPLSSFAKSTRISPSTITSLIKSPTPRAQPVPTQKPTLTSSSFNSPKFSHVHTQQNSPSPSLSVQTCSSSFSFHDCSDRCGNKNFHYGTRASELSFFSFLKVDPPEFL